MIRDRGRIKWNSLMLPEHVKMLRGWAEEDAIEQQKRLDEQKLELLNETAGEAMECGKEVTISHYANSHYEDVAGKIHYFDAINEQFRIVDHAGTVHRISLKDIGEIRFVD